MGIIVKVKLGEIVGKVISGEWGNDDEIGNGIPVLRTTNFTNDGMIDFTNVVTRSITKKDISSKYLQTGDIIIEKSGGSDKQPVGRVVYFEGTSNTYLFNNFTGLLRIKDSLQWDSKYLFYTLFANYLKGGTLQYQNKTTGLHNLKTEQFVKNFEVNKIDIMEQRHIAAVLDKVSDLIALRKKQLAKLDELVKARFVEMFGDPLDIQTNWENSTIGEKFSVTSGGTPATEKDEYWENGKIPWIGSNMCQNVILYENDGKYITEAGYSNSSAKWFYKGTVLIALVGATIGKTALLRFDTTTNQNIAAIDVNSNKNFVSEFVFYHLQMLYNKFTEIGGDKFKMANQGFIRQLPLICPPVLLQQQFADFVEQVEKQKKMIKQSLEKLETLKKSLMQQYFG
jgi:type I restriction enzyme S subunit